MSLASSARIKMRDYINREIKSKNDHDDFTDDESLFVSGRMDSMAAMKFLLFMEQEFGVRFKDIGFDLEKIDSIDASIELLPT